MEQQFWCAAWPDGRMAEKRLSEVRGIGPVEVDGRRMTVRAFTAESAAEAALRLRELGWRPML